MDAAKAVFSDVYGIDMSSVHDYAEAQKRYKLLVVTASELEIIDTMRSFSAKNVKNVKSSIIKMQAEVMKVDATSSVFQASVAKEMARIARL